MVDDSGLIVRVFAGQRSGRDALRELVAELAGVRACDVTIQARCPDCGGDHGRPVVMGPPAALHVQVSLSHVGETVVAAASAGRAVGVDAEAEAVGSEADGSEADERRRRSILAIAGRESDDPLSLWTALEAVLKADGRGLRVDPSEVTIESSGTGADRSIAWVADDERRYEVFALETHPGLRISVARALG